MKVVHSPTHLIHHPRWEFTHGRRIYSKDIPSRATLIRDALLASDMRIDLVPPDAYPLSRIETLHAFVGFLRDAAATLEDDSLIYPDVFPVRRKVNRPDHQPALAGYYCFDTGTPISRHTFEAAKSSADCALTASDLIPTEGLVYALCRPPGHHAEREVFGGYCYFNNAALAAHALAEHGRVAVLDIDYHHGNGTQDIFYASSRVFTLSIHGDPAVTYPYFSGFADERGEGEGLGYNLNLPLAPGSGISTYLAALDEALSAIKRFDPQYLVVAVGFDTCRGDPAGSFDLATRHYPVIASRIAKLGLPCLIVQEGGYRTQNLGKNAVAFLSAFGKELTDD
ncbi:Acetylpolyamine aminohydrolase [compost metagenome]